MTAIMIRAAVLLAFFSVTYGGFSVDAQDVATAPQGVAPSAGRPRSRVALERGSRLVRLERDGRPITCEVRVDGSERCIEGTLRSRRAARGLLLGGIPVFLGAIPLALLGALLGGYGCSHGSDRTDCGGDAFVASTPGIAIGAAGITMIGLGSAWVSQYRRGMRALGRLPFAVGTMSVALDRGGLSLAPRGLILQFSF